MSGKAKPAERPVCKWAYRRLLKALGGRKAVPRGGPLDRAMVAAVNDAAEVAAIRERGHALGTVREVRGRLGGWAAAARTPTTGRGFTGASSPRACPR